ncbi:MAG: caspase family protein [Spirochaetaceae bacterium]|nr:caspase family protein [Spirochaetaceae bacterium]
MRKKALLIDNRSESNSEVSRLKECLEKNNPRGLEVLHLKDPSYEEAYRETKKFFSVNGEDCLLIYYYSGHTERDAVTNELYLYHKNTNPRNRELTTLKSSILQSFLKSQTKSRKVIIIDSINWDNHSTYDFPIEGDETALISGSGFSQSLITGLESGSAVSGHHSKMDINDIYSYIYRSMENSRKRECLRRRINSSGMINLTDSSLELRENPEQEKGWNLIKENEIYTFFLLYFEVDFDITKFKIDDIWKDHIEKYLFNPELNDDSVWKKFCGNDVSRKGIYIAPVQKENIAAIKSIFRIFLNKQVDDIRVNRRDIKIKYYFTVLDLPYKRIDSSERLIPECNNIYKLAENLDSEKLYLSGDVIDLLPLNIKKNLQLISHKSDLFTYTFNLLT